MLRMAMGAAVALLIAAAPAQAAKVEQRTGGDGAIELHVVGDAGANDISVRGEEFDVGGDPGPDYGNVYVRDDGPAPLEVGTGLCHPTADPHEVVCEDYDDTATIPRPAAARLIVELGPGADSYSDTLDAYGRPAFPDVNGGTGDDTISFSGQGGNSDGGDGRDVIDAGAPFGVHHGGAGSDTIVGSDGPEEIDAGPGADTLRAGGGPDILTSRDDAPDHVDCGAGNDTIEADFRDALAGCEVADVSANPDGDGAAPADAGGDATAVDADGDALQPPSIVRASLSSNFAVFKRYTKVKLLTVRNFEDGIAVSLRCRGKGCPFKRKSVKANGRKVGLAEQFEHRRLRKGAVIQVRIAKSGTIGKVVKIKIRKRKLPKSTPLCLPPGAGRPGRCGA